jgi:hypothetical protein
LCFRLFNGAVPLCVRSNGKAEQRDQKAADPPPPKARRCLYALGKGSRIRAPIPQLVPSPIGS